MIFHNLCNIVHKIGNKLVEFFKEKAFTLAEIMVALVVIGVITSILLPVAFNNLPNENVMKFKKGNATLAKVVNELVMSDRYYKDGDLGVKADGEVVNGKHEGDYKYFCSTFADVVQVKKLECGEFADGIEGHTYFLVAKVFGTLEQAMKYIDAVCKAIEKNTKEEIVTSDNIYFYQTNAKSPFGISYKQNQQFFQGSQDCLTGNFEAPYCKEDARLYSSPNGPIYFQDENGMDRVYKAFCIDVDGIGKGEDPFGYGIRADGKIILGARAQEWLNKNIQDKE